MLHSMSIVCSFVASTFVDNKRPMQLNDHLIVIGEWVLVVEVLGESVERVVEDIRQRHHHMVNVGVEPLVVLQVERRLHRQVVGWALMAVPLVRLAVVHFDQS